MIINLRSVGGSVLASVTGEVGGVVYARFIMTVYARSWRPRYGI